MDYHTVTPGEIGALQEEIADAVEQESGYGRSRPDWHRVIDRIENGEPSRDLGTDMTSPVIREILKRARRIYRELREN